MGKINLKKPKSSQMLAELSLISNIKNEITKAGSAVKNDW